MSGKGKKDGGYAIIVTLVLAAALMISVGAALSILHVLHQRSQIAKRKLVEKAEKVARASHSGEKSPSSR
jgi:hypothetical protein